MITKEEKPHSLLVEVILLYPFFPCFPTFFVLSVHCRSIARIAKRQPKTREKYLMYQEFIPMDTINLS